MPNWPKRVFDAGMERADRLLRFYGILQSPRTRRVTRGGQRDFNAVVGWRRSRKITLLGGAGRSSVIAIHSGAPLGAADFLHDPTSDILRAAHVLCLSAMDRYFHDKVIEKSWSLLNRNPTPAELAKFNVPLSVLRDALTHLRKNKSARPGAQVKTALQSLLHKKTFQSTDEVLGASRMLGIDDFWGKTATHMGHSWSKKKVMDRLNAAVRRRNQIAHEGDFVLMTRTRDPKLRDIVAKRVKDDLHFIREFVAACETFV